jgi:hypothetical protein
MPAPAVVEPPAIDIVAKAQADDEKSELTATSLAVIGSLLPMATTAVGLTLDGDLGTRVTGSGLALSLVGPSFGHWYTGEFLTKGMVARAGGALLLLAGADAALSARSGIGMFEDDGAAGAMLLGGAALYVGGAIYDIATAGKAAHKYNVERYQVMPTRLSTTNGKSGAFGLAVGGTF